MLTIRASSGGDGNLNLAIGTYGPNPPAAESVQCRGRMTEISSCRDLISTLPVDHQPRVFGLEEDPRRDVQIPKTMDSCKNLLFSGFPLFFVAFSPLSAFLLKKNLQTTADAL